MTEPRTHPADTRPRTAPADAPHSSLPLGLAVTIAVFVGGLYALQSRVNGELGLRLGDGFTAAAISFGSGLAILCVAMALVPGGRRGLGTVRSALRGPALSWWHLLGGVSGAFFVLSQGLSAAVLGIALFTVAIVAGQTLSGVFMDLLGVGPGGRRPLTAKKIIGAVLALAAVGWAVSGQVETDVPLWLLALPLLAGIGQGWQQAVNGRVRHVSSALTATFLNFLSGTIVLLVAAVGHGLVAGFPAALPADPWLYAGGAIGCVFIAAATIVVRVTGVLLLGLSIVAGQLLGALTLDVLFPSAGHPLAASTVAGSALALLAVALVGIRWRRPRRPRAGERPS